MLLSYKYPSCIMISLHEGVSVPPCSRTQSIFLIMLYLVFLLPFRTLGLPPPVCVCVFSVAQTCLTLSGPMDCSPTDSSAHGIFQARILECDAISYSRKSSQPRYLSGFLHVSWVSCTGSEFFTTSTTCEAHYVPASIIKNSTNESNCSNTCSNNVSREVHTKTYLLARQLMMANWTCLLASFPSAAAAKSLQSCPWDSLGENTGVGCHFLLQCMKVKSESEVAQSCPTLSDPMDCSLPGSSIHGIFQAKVLEWGAIAFSTFPSNPC